MAWRRLGTDLTTPCAGLGIRPGLSRRRPLLWPVLLTAAITWESVEAVPSIGPAWLSIDKLAHFGVFGLLATTVARLDQAKHWRLLGPLWAIVLVSVYGLGDELLQGFTPDRSMEFADWVADTIGAAVAVVVYLRWNWYRRVLETPLWRRRRRQPRVEISPESGPNPPT